MKLLLDQGLPSSAAALLRSMSIDTIHISEIEMSAAADVEILQKAKEEDRIVVTLDADFHALLALAEATSPSVIRIRIERLRAAALVELLRQVTSECAEELLRGAAVTVEPGKIRTRYLPLLPTA